MIFASKKKRKRIWKKINLDINIWKKKQEERRLKQIENNLNLGRRKKFTDEKSVDEVNDNMVVEGL